MVFDILFCSGSDRVHGVYYFSGSDHINVVWYLYCSGSDRDNGVCKDGSDQAYCLHTIYTGSFLNTTLGLREYFSIKNAISSLLKMKIYIK